MLEPLAMGAVCAAVLSNITGPAHDTVAVADWLGDGVSDGVIDADAVTEVVDDGVCVPDGERVLVALAVSVTEGVSDAVCVWLALRVRELLCV